jgi:uncharacterized Tic20 family protein
MSSSDKPPVAASPDDRTWGMLAHLSALIAMAAGGMTFIGPLIVWLVKKDQSPFVVEHAKEALNFQLACFIAALICVPLAFVIVGFILLPVVVVGNVIFSIIAAMEANKGLPYRYPYTIRLIT